MKEANVLHNNLNTELPYPPNMSKKFRHKVIYLLVKTSKLYYRMYAVPIYRKKIYYTYVQYFIKDFDSTRVATTLYGDSRQLKDLIR